MAQGSSITARRAFVQFFSMLCLAGLCCGVALCLFKSAGNKGYVIATMAQEYYRQAARPGVSPESAAYLNTLAREAMMQAIAHDPKDGGNWSLLAAILEQDSDYNRADKARAVAARLGHGSGDQAFNHAAPGNIFAAQIYPSSRIVPERE